MSNNNGGPAFPGERLARTDGYKTKEREPVAGMTLRDYFAAKAMQASLSEALAARNKECVQAVAGVAYEIADAMLAERVKK